MREVNQDLKQLPPPYREPFTKYVWHGTIPYAHLPLMLLLTGKATQCDIENDPGLMVVQAFLDKYEADLDIAHGHLGYLLRWQAWGGKSRKP
jgi:hypothetical protein